MSEEQLLETVRRGEIEVQKIRAEYLRTQEELERIRHAAAVELACSKTQFYQDGM